MCPPRSICEELQCDELHSENHSLYLWVDLQDVNEISFWFEYMVKNRRCLSYYYVVSSQISVFNYCKFQTDSVFI